MGYGGRFAARIVGGGVPDAPQWGAGFSPAHGFLSGVVGRPALWPPWPFAAAGKYPGGMNPSPMDEPLTAV